METIQIHEIGSIIRHYHSPDLRLSDSVNYCESCGNLRIVFYNCNYFACIS